MDHLVGLQRDHRVSDPGPAHTASSVTIFSLEEKIIRLCIENLISCQSSLTSGRSRGGEGGGGCTWCVVMCGVRVRYACVCLVWCVCCGVCVVPCVCWVVWYEVYVSLWCGVCMGCVYVCVCTHDDNSIQSSSAMTKKEISP